MALTYICPTCAAEMAVDAPVDSLKCPACRIPMKLAEAPAGEPDGVSPSASASEQTATPVAFKGLKVARPVHNLGEDLDSSSRHVARPTDAAKSQRETPRSDRGSGLAAEMEKMVETTRIQAGKEAELILETARLKARQEAEAYRRQLEKDLEQEVVAIRENHADQARSEAARIVQEAQAEAEKEAAQIRKDTLQRAEEAVEAIRARAETEAQEARQALVSQAQTLAHEAKAKAEKIGAEAEKNAARKVAEAMEIARKKMLEQAEKVAELARDKGKKDADKIRAEATAASEKIVADAKKTAAETLENARQDARKLAAETSTDTAKDGHERTRELEKENERLRQSLEKRGKADIEAKEKALHDANETHKVQFRTSLLLRVIGPVLLIYGLFMVAKADGAGWEAASVLFLLFSLGLSVWGLLLGRRLKKHVDGLFEFFFKDQLRDLAKAASDGGPAGPTDSGRATSRKTGPRKTAVTFSKAKTNVRFSKSKTRGKKASSTKKGSKAAAGETRSKDAAEPAPAAEKTDEKIVENIPGDSLPDKIKPEHGPPADDAPSTASSTDEKASSGTPAAS